MPDLQIVKTAMPRVQIVEPISELLHVEGTVLVVQIAEVHPLKVSLLDIPSHVYITIPGLLHLETVFLEAQPVGTFHLETLQMEALTCRQI